MCIIVAKKKNVKAPTIDTLKTCFYNNSDGAGFMYVGNNGKVVIDKGYMTFKSFEKHYKKLLKKYNNFDNKNLVMHFRIGTSGSNNTKNTHPFPVTSNIEDLKKPYFLTDLGLVHNGIISDYTIRNNNTHDISDTMNFITSFLAPLYSGYKEFYINTNVMDGIEKLISSKLCLLNSKDNMYLLGNFESDKNGVLYSNGTYKTNWWSGYNYGYDSYKSTSTNELAVWENLENEYIPPKSDLLQLKNEWYISYASGKVEQAKNNLFYDLYEGDLYYETFDGELIKEASDILVLDKRGELIY